MNQILSMNQDNPSFGNNYNNYNMNNGGNNDKLNIKTVKMIFSISLIVFGLVMFISGLAGTIIAFSKPTGTVIEYPIISTMQNDNILTLTIQNDVAIELVEYSWNNGRTLEIEGDSSLDLTRDISIPQGNNVLKLSIYDVNGKLTERTKNVVGEFIADTIPPKIELVVISSKLNISAKSASETKLSYLTYKWNNDPEIKIEATGNKTDIDTSIDILNGTNTLTVMVMNENGISETQVKEFKGIKKPVIEVKKDEENEFVLVKITHDTGVKSADITCNNKSIVLTPDHFGGKEVEFKVRLKEDVNVLKIVATSLDDSTETFNGTIQKD